MVRIKYYIIIAACLCCVYSCSKNKFDVDITNIKVDVTINRLDLDLMANYPDTPDVKLLQNKYDKFFELYTKLIIEIGEPGEPNFTNYLMEFNNYCKEYSIPSKVETEYGDLNNLKSSINNAFRYYKFYFPDKKIPAIYTFLSGFRMSVVTDEGILGIGLDKYLGANCDLYAAQGIDKYKVRRMEASMIPADCMRAIAISEFPYIDSVNNLLNQIVYEGKVQYFLDAMLPFESDTIKFGYTKDQFEWAQYNESKMWAHLIENQILFSTDDLIIRKMIGDSPFTALFANNSAPRAGAFLGWKIVHKYMEMHPEIDLNKLMLYNDYQGILNAAGYKP